MRVPNFVAAVGSHLQNLCSINWKKNIWRHDRYIQPATAGRNDDEW